MIKSREISEPKSCLNKAAPEEPLFVLRAQDVFAPSIIREWAYKVMLTRNPNLAKIQEALDCANQMQDWQNRKVPD